MKHHTSYKLAVQCTLDDSALYVKVHHGVPTPRSHDIDICFRSSRHSLSVKAGVVTLTQMYFLKVEGPQHEVSKDGAFRQCSDLQTSSKKNDERRINVQSGHWLPPSRVFRPGLPIFRPGPSCYALVQSQWNGGEGFTLLQQFDSDAMKEGRGEGSNRLTGIFEGIEDATLVCTLQIGIPILQGLLGRGLDDKLEPIPRMIHSPK